MATCAANEPAGCRGVVVLEVVLDQLADLAPAPRWSPARRGLPATQAPDDQADDGERDTDRHPPAHRSGRAPPGRTRRRSGPGPPGRVLRAGDRRAGPGDQRRQPGDQRRVGRGRPDHGQVGRRRAGRARPARRPRRRPGVPRPRPAGAAAAPAGPTRRGARRRRRRCPLLDHPRLLDPPQTNLQVRDRAGCRATTRGARRDRPGHRRGGGPRACGWPSWPAVRWRWRSTSPCSSACCSSGSLVPSAARSSFVDEALARPRAGVHGAVIVGYPVAFETLTRGRSLGKMALGLRVVREDGGPERFRQAFVRGLLGGGRDLADLRLVALVASLASAQGRRIGDYLAGTVVIHERVPVARLTGGRDAAAAGRLGRRAGPVPGARRPGAGRPAVPRPGPRAVAAGARRDGRLAGRRPGRGSPRRRRPPASPPGRSCRRCWPSGGAASWPGSAALARRYRGRPATAARHPPPPPLPPPPPAVLPPTPPPPCPRRRRARPAPVRPDDQPFAPPS